MIQKDIHAHRIAIRHDEKLSITGQWLYRSVGIPILTDMVAGHTWANPFFTPTVFRFVDSAKPRFIL